MIIRQLSDLDQPHWYQRNDNLNHIHYIYELQLNPIDILTVLFGCFDREMCVFMIWCIVIAYLKTTHTHRLRFVFSDCNRLNFREQTRLSSMPSKWQMNRVRCSNLTFPLFDAAISWGSESRNRAARHTRSLYHHIGGGFLHTYESTTDTYIVVQINVRWTKQQPHTHTDTQTLKQHITTHCHNTGRTNNVCSVRSVVVIKRWRFEAASRLTSAYRYYLYICANNKWYVVCVHGGPDSQRRRHCILLLHSIERRTINSSARLSARFCISVVFLCCIFICCILSLDTRSHPSPHRGVLIDVYT